MDLLRSVIHTSLMIPTCPPAVGVTKVQPSHHTFVPPFVQPINPHTTLFYKGGKNGICTGVALTPAWATCTCDSSEARLRCPRIFLKYFIAQLKTNANANMKYFWFEIIRTKVRWLFGPYPASGEVPVGWIREIPAQGTSLKPLVSVCTLMFSIQ